MKIVPATPKTSATASAVKKFLKIIDRDEDYLSGMSLETLKKVLDSYPLNILEKSDVEVHWKNLTTINISKGSNLHEYDKLFFYSNWLKDRGITSPFEQYSIFFSTLGGIAYSWRTFRTDYFAIKYIESKPEGKPYWKAWGELSDDKISRIQLFNIHYFKGRTYMKMFSPIFPVLYTTWRIFGVGNAFLED